MSQRHDPNCFAGWAKAHSKTGFSGWRELFSKLSAKTSVQVSRVPKLTVSLWIRNVCGRHVIYLSAMHTWKQRFYKTALCDPGSLPQFYFFFSLDQPTHFNERKGERKHFMGMVSLLKFYNISFTFSLSRFKDTGEKKAHKIVLPSAPLP